MIHRKWSLLTGPAAILGGIVASLVVANFIFVKEDPFLKAYKKKRADRLQQALERNIIVDEVPDDWQDPTNEPPVVELYE